MGRIMEMKFKLLIVQLRSMQLYYHNCHNLVKGPTFLPDHELFGEFYPALESDYDSAAERAIGLFNEPLDLNVILPAISKNLEAVLSNYNDNNSMLQGSVVLEHELLKIVNLIDSDPLSSPGVKQLVGDIADKSEARLYKLNQRLKS